MSIQKDYLKNRFTIRYNQEVAGVDLFKSCISLIESISEEENSVGMVEKFLESLPSFKVSEEDMNETKQIFHEFTSGQMSKNETIAYFNYLHDTAYSKAHNMLLIQDIFKCYF